MQFSRRNRTVYFRLTDAEYRELENASHLQGARSVSDFTRRAVLQSIDLVIAAPSLQQRLNRVGHALNTIREEVTLLAHECEPQGQE